MEVVVTELRSQLSSHMRLTWVGWGQGRGDGTDSRVMQPGEVVCTKAAEQEEA